MLPLKIKCLNVSVDSNSRSSQKRILLNTAFPIKDWYWDKLGFFILQAYYITEISYKILYYNRNTQNTEMLDISK